MNNNMDYLYNKRKRDEEKEWNIYKISKLKQKREKVIKLYPEIIINKSYYRNKNKEINQDSVISIDSDISIENSSPKNDSTNNKTQNGNSNLFYVEHYFDDSDKIETKNNELIKRKRDIVKEIIKDDMKRLGDIEKYLYREFKEYLRINRDNFHLYNDFWDLYFAQRTQ